MTKAAIALGAIQNFLMDFALQPFRDVALAGDAGLDAAQHGVAGHILAVGDIGDQHRRGGLGRHHFGQAAGFEGVERHVARQRFIGELAHLLGQLATVFLAVILDEAVGNLGDVLGALFVIRRGGFACRGFGRAQFRLVNDLNGGGLFAHKLGS